MSDMTIEERVEQLQMKNEFNHSKQRIIELERENRELRKEIAKLRRRAFNEYDR